MTDTDDELKDMTAVPLPGESAAEHDRVRSSNDRDQKLEQEGKVAPHNRGYDEAVRGRGPEEPKIERVVDED
jgi:hypothetical protein